MKVVERDGTSDRSVTGIEVSAAKPGTLAELCTMIEPAWSPGVDGVATVSVKLPEALKTPPLLRVAALQCAPDVTDAVAPLDEGELMEFFGTAEPPAKDVEECDDLFEQIERGQGVYVVVYENHKPSQILFAGYSYD